MHAREIVTFLKTNIRPIDDDFAGPRYRASARLVDGTALPCVVFESERRHVELALRRFKEESGSPDDYRRIVEAFVVSGNRLASWDIASVELSPFALDVEHLLQIRGETSMGWTRFDAVMHDGRRVSMGTTFSFDFFDLPTGYSPKDIVRIEQIGSPLAPGLPPYIAKPESGEVYREKPFFTCYLADL